MADEYVCEECAYTTANDEKDCPLCGGRIISLEDVLEKDQMYDEFGQDGVESSVGDDFDFDADPAI